MVGLILDDGAKIMFFIFSGVALIVCFAYQLLAVSHPYSLDYGEAPLVDHAMHLASGENIYRTDLSTPPYTISNYPPLYIALLAIGVKLFGPAGTFFFGRMISVLCTWAASIFLMLIVYRTTRDRVAGLSAGLVFLAFPFVVFWSPLLRIDMLALALSLGGLCLLIWRPVSSRGLLPVALLLVAAIYTRQSYGLAAPLAAFVWLVVRDWRQALRLALLVGGLGAVLFLILNTLTHGGFFFNIVTANVNEFKMDLLKYNWDQLRKAALIPLWIAGFSLVLIPRWNPLWALAAPYLIGATLSAATIGKIGSNVNYLLELCAAVGLAAGTVIAWSRVHLSFYSLRAVVLVLLAFGVGRMVRALQDFTGDLRERRAATNQLSQLESFVAETPGPILADEYMGMLTLQGRPLFIQPFEVTQLALAGKWDQDILIDQINNKEFASIILYDRPWLNERWTPEMLSAINKSYRLVDIIAENRVYTSFEPAVTTRIEACPAAKWRLPSDASLGLEWSEKTLDFFGHGKEDSIAVYAVADGLLTRKPDWVDAVAILHEDPSDPTNKVWAIYSGMAAANGTDSYIVADFPPGVTDIPVKSGQLLGYQGTWSGTPQWPSWMHTFLVVFDTVRNDALPAAIPPGGQLDPAPFMGLSVDRDNQNLQPIKCGRP